jgi:hypothetical protein
MYIGSLQQPVRFASAYNGAISEQMWEEGGRRRDLKPFFLLLTHKGIERHAIIKSNFASCT